MLDSFDRLPDCTDKEYNELSALYERVRNKVTLNGKPARVTRLGKKFHMVFQVPYKGIEAEFSHAATMRILNGHCNFQT